MTTVRGSDYHAVSNLETSGVVNAFWQAEIQATSSGKVGAKNLTPALYDSFDINRTGKKQEVSLTYDSANPPRLYADPPYSTTGYEVKPEDQKATLDPLSAVMFIVSGAGTAGTPCTVTAPVFDGRRRYNIEMSKVKDIEHQDGQWPVCGPRHTLPDQVSTNSPVMRAAGAAQSQ